MACNGSGRGSRQIRIQATLDGAAFGQCDTRRRNAAQADAAGVDDHSLCLNRAIDAPEHAHAFGAERAADLGALLDDDLFTFNRTGDLPINAQELADEVTLNTCIRGYNSLVHAGLSKARCTQGRGAGQQRLRARRTRG